MASRPWITVLAVALILPAGWAYADVNLELRPTASTVIIGDLVEVGLYAVSDDGTNQAVRAMDVILAWDPATLALDQAQPLVNNGPYAWLMSGFYSDSSADGLNNTWADGNAFYQAVGNFVSLAYATPEGLLVTTFRFHALTNTPSTNITILPSFGLVTQTRVWGEGAGQDVTGTLGSATIQIGPTADWGLVSLELSDAACWVEPGELFVVELWVSELAQEIDGIQAIIEFAPEVLSFVGALPGDGVGSPWDAAVEVYEDAAAGTLVYAIVLLDGGATAADAVAAELTFRFQPSTVPAAGAVAVVAAMPPLETRLTEAATGAPITPALGLAVVAVSPGDYNGDGALTFADFEGFATCMAGPGNLPCCDECCRLDFNVDDDVDLADFATLQQALPQP
ncbi:MAG: hypothetical protein KA383_09595 [Phycisphaerae bacterium]|nr:hypothetical protein [Phycisphaerae bacterium]